MKKVAFICTHNSCRSQIAESLAKHFCRDYESFSAGSEPRPINKTAVRLVFEMYGIDISANKPKLISEIPTPDIAISMGCGVKCPYIGREFDEDWELEDPSEFSDDEFKKVIKEIKKRVLELKNKINEI